VFERIWIGNDSRVHTTTDEEGRFELRGTLFEKTVDLVFQSALRVERRLSKLPLGLQHVVVQLPRTGGLRARFEIPSGASRIPLSISLRHEDDGSDGAKDEFNARIDDREEFLVDGRWPGPWTMVLSQGDRELLQRSGIVIRGGEITDLGVLRIDEAATAIHLSVTSAATGQPLAGAYLVRPRGTGRIEQLFADAPFDATGPRRFSAGEIEILAPEESVDVVVISPEHRAEVVTAHAGHQELQLRRALRVPLRIEGFAGAPPLPSELRLAVVIGDETFFPLRTVAPELGRVGWSSPFDGSGRAEVALPVTGTFPIHWIVVTPDDHGLSWDSFEGRETLIEVDAGPAGERLLHTDRDTSKRPDERR
jgi:hypothetical protein